MKIICDLKAYPILPSDSIFPVLFWFTSYTFTSDVLLKEYTQRLPLFCFSSIQRGKFLFLFMYPVHFLKTAPEIYEIGHYYYPWCKISIIILFVLFFYISCLDRHPSETISLPSEGRDSRDNAVYPLSSPRLNLWDDIEHVILLWERRVWIWL